MSGHVDSLLQESREDTVQVVQLNMVHRRNYLIFTEKRTRGCKKAHVQKYFKLRRLIKETGFFASRQECEARHVDFSYTLTSMSDEVARQTTKL